jgi:hypothetical protein
VSVMATETFAPTIEDRLRWAVWRAKRRMPKVGDAEHPTPWDVEHREIDSLLDRLVRP